MSFLSPNEYGSVIGLFSGVLTSLWIGFADKPKAVVSLFSFGSKFKALIVIMSFTASTDNS